jgi:hypothetical protein
MRLKLNRRGIYLSFPRRTLTSNVHNRIPTDVGVFFQHDRWNFWVEAGWKAREFGFTGVSFRLGRKYLAIAFGTYTILRNAPQIGLFWGRNWGRHYGVAIGLDAHCFHGLWIQW